MINRRTSMVESFRRHLIIPTAFMGTLTAVTSSEAQTMKRTTITMVRTGWNADSFAIVTTDTIENPAKCPTANGYASEKSLPGYATYYAAALTAYIARRRVTIVVHDTECVQNAWPKLIGINLINE